MVGLALPMSKFIHMCKPCGRYSLETDEFVTIKAIQLSIRTFIIYTLKVPAWNGFPTMGCSTVQHQPCTAVSICQSVCSQSQHQGRALETRLRTRRSMETMTRPLLPSGITKFLSGDTSVLATTPVSFPAGGTQPVEVNSDIIVRRVNTEVALCRGMWRRTVCDARCVARSQTTLF